MSRTVLIIGRGAREHALGAKLATSPLVERIVVAPGNAGTARELSNHRLTAVDHLPEIVDLVDELKPDLVIVGPEAPLVAGVSDLLRPRGVRVFGPGTNGARLEGSKGYAKQFFLRHGLPTSPAELFADAGLAHAFIDAAGFVPVVKPDGLTGGKGVVVPATKTAAHEAVERMLGRGDLGDAGKLVVLEAPVFGEEVSLTLLLDGKRFLVLPAARDHKRLHDGERGPNTGGMGAVAPSPRVDAALLDSLVKTLVLPLLKGFHAEGIDYRGALTLGLSLDAMGAPTVLEINARFGDPEICAQVGIVDEDLYPLLEAAADGALPRSGVLSVSGYSAAVVLATAGYPQAAASPARVTGLAATVEVPGTYVFHGATHGEGDEVWAESGRAFVVSGVGEDAEEARASAYRAAAMVSFAGKQLRFDVGAEVSAGR